MVYISSDFHLGHKVITKYRPKFNSAEEHDEFILSKIEALTKRDILLVLGDFLFDGPKYDEYLNRLKNMKCRIKLVMGNHDSIKLYKDCIDSNIEIQLPLYTYKNMWASHCPIHQQELRGRVLNIHGHLHGGTINNYGTFMGQEYVTENSKYYNVNLDNNDFEFVKLDDVLKYKESIERLNKLSYM